MNRVERLAAILLLLQEQPSTAGEIAQHFEVSRRTILRDVQALSEMGVPVIAREGPGGGYSLPGDYHPEPLPLTGSEAFLLLLALSGIERLADLPFREQRASLSAKLKALLPKAGLPGVQKLLETVEIDLPGQGPRTPYLEPLIEAAQQKQWLQVVYRSSERLSTQHLQPRQIYTQNGFWYLRALAHERGEERTYRVDRIQSIQPPAPDFQPEPEAAPLPYGHESHPQVVVQLTARGVAQMEMDRHLASQIRRREDGSGELAFRCPPGELDWFAGRFAGLGTDVLVEKPEELRQQMLRIGEKLVETYQKR